MSTSLADAVPLLAGHRILVVGDVSLDEYVFGRATRLSREAPVPVLEFERRDYILGGAANPSRNIVALASSAIQAGIVGSDAAGQQLLADLQTAGIDSQAMLSLADRPTTCKTRILAQDPPRLPQQLARLDQLSRAALPPADEQHLIAIIADQIPQVDAVICSDYQIGLLSPYLVESIRTLCRRHDVLLCVDAQGNAHYYQGVDLFRCNNVEAAAAVGFSLRTETDYRAALQRLRSDLDARLVIVTRGPDGLSIEGDDLPYTRLPAIQVSEVFDTTGAGDTFIAVATLALAAGRPALAAAHLANTAAGLVVRRLGNAVVGAAELRAALQLP
jgi:D-glycero-beta-D-manno-heptose-7-phosphate kinase